MSRRSRLTLLLLGLATAPLLATEIVWPTTLDLTAVRSAQDYLQPTVSGRLESATFGMVREEGQRFHEGVDIHAAQPDADASFALPDGRVLTRRDPVVTYVARNLEPYRGYPQFIRALVTMQQRHPGLQALIIGGDEISYGSAPEGHATWRERMAHEVPLDPARTHHVGRLTHRRYLDALRVGSAHVYLTYPFVLSWSALEAMACGCHLIGSATPPVQEVVEHGRNGWLTGFFDGDALADAVLDALAEPQRHAALRTEARRTVVERYSHEAGTRAWLTLILGPGQTPAEPA